MGIFFRNSVRNFRNSVRKYGDFFPIFSKNPRISYHINMSALVSCCINMSRKVYIFVTILLTPRLQL